MTYWFGLRTDPKEVAINNAIEANGSEVLRDDHYPFQVLRLEGAVAVMVTPRSSSVPVYRMTRAHYPGLAGRATDYLDFSAAERELTRVQLEARNTVLQQPSITDVKWVVGERYFLLLTEL